MKVRSKDSSKPPSVVYLTCPHGNLLKIVEIGVECRVNREGATALNQHQVVLHVVRYVYQIVFTVAKH